MNMDHLEKLLELLNDKGRRSDAYADFNHWLLRKLLRASECEMGKTQPELHEIFEHLASDVHDHVVAANAIFATAIAWPDQMRNINVAAWARKYDSGFNEFICFGVIVGWMKAVAHLHGHRGSKPFDAEVAEMCACKLGDYVVEVIHSENDISRLSSAAQGEVSNAIPPFLRAIDCRLFFAKLRLEKDAIALRDLKHSGLAQIVDDMTVKGLINALPVDYRLDVLVGEAPGAI